MAKPSKKAAESKTSSGKSVPSLKAKSQAKAPEKAQAKAATKAPAKAPAKTSAKSQPKASAKAPTSAQAKDKPKAPPAAPLKAAQKVATQESPKVAPKVQPAPEAEASEEVDPSKGRELMSKAALRKLEAKLRSENDAAKRWQSVFEQYGKAKAAPYTMSGSFEASQAIQHKVLGWGLILESRDNRIQVLFKDGVRTLITNYR